MALQKGQQLAGKLKTAVDASKLDDASNLLGELKMLLTQFDSLPPMNKATPQAAKERLLGRQVLELAVFWAIKQQDRASFQRQMAQLKPYYLERGLGLPDSELRGPILGLNLLYLLVENRLAEFHSELEHLSDTDRADRHVSFSINLEQNLMVGSYHKVLESRRHMPHAAYELFMSLLVDTVRDAIGECSEAAYERLQTDVAQKMLFLDSEHALKQYALDKHPDWGMDGGYIHFADHQEQKLPQVPSLRLIQEMLSYATELERIV